MSILSTQIMNGKVGKEEGTRQQRIELGVTGEEIDRIVGAEGLVADHRQEVQVADVAEVQRDAPANRPKKTRLHMLRFRTLRPVTDQQSKRA